MYAYSNRSKLNTSLAVDNDFSLNLRPEVTVNMAFFILLAVIIIATNLLVPASIYINPRLRCPTYLLILSLSAADLMVGLFLLPVRVIELLSYDWTREFVWCQMSSSLNLFSLSASLLSLLAVTADRFLAISYSLRYRTMITSNRIYVTIAAVWVTAFTVSFLPLFGLWMKPVELYRVHRLCLFGDVMEGIYMALFFVFICAAPTMLITLAYVKIFALARSQERRIASLKVFADMGPTQLPTHKRVSFTRESKAAKTTAIVIGLFYICWSPFFAEILLTIFRKEEVSYVLVAVTACAVYSNSAINPLVYGFLNQDFKNTYKQLVKKLFRSCRPKALSKNAQVSPITMAHKESEQQTITAAIPTTPIETVSQNSHPGTFFHERTLQIHFEIHDEHNEKQSPPVISDTLGTAS